MSQCSTGLIWGSWGDALDLRRLCGGDGASLPLEEQAEGSLKAWWKIVNSNCG
jgi:hypothetical protein